MSPLTEAAHMDLKRAHRMLYRAEAYAARLRCELATTPAGTDHARTITIELKAACAHVVRYRYRYDVAWDIARAVTPQKRGT